MQQFTDGQVSSAIHLFRRWSLQEGFHPGAINRALHADSARARRQVRAALNLIESGQNRSALQLLECTRKSVIAIPKRYSIQYGGGNPRIHSDSVLEAPAPSAAYFVVEILWLARWGVAIDQLLGDEFFAGRIAFPFRSGELAAHRIFRDGRRQHRQWKRAYRASIDAIRAEGADAGVVRIDFTEYFANIKPGFDVIAKSFGDRHGIDVGTDPLTRFIAMAHRRFGPGNPIGLPISRVASNMLLDEPFRLLQEGGVRLSNFVDDTHLVFPMIDPSDDPLRGLEDYGGGLFVRDPDDGALQLTAPDDSWRLPISETKLATGVFLTRDLQISPSRKVEESSDDETFEFEDFEANGSSGDGFAPLWGTYAEDDPLGHAWLSAPGGGVRPNYALLTHANDAINDLQLGGDNDEATVEAAKGLVYGITAHDYWSLRDHWGTLILLASFVSETAVGHVVSMLAQLEVDEGNSIASTYLENGIAVGLAGRGVDSRAVSAALRALNEDARDRVKSAVRAARNYAMFDDLHSPFPAARSLPFRGDLYSAKSFAAFAADPSNEAFIPKVSLANRRGVPIDQLDLRLHRMLREIFTTVGHGDVAEPEPVGEMLFRPVGFTRTRTGSRRVTLVTAPIDPDEVGALALGPETTLTACLIRRRAVWLATKQAQLDGSRLMVTPEFFVSPMMLRRVLRSLARRRVSAVLSLSPIVMGTTYANVLVTCMWRWIYPYPKLEWRLKSRLSPHEVKFAKDEHLTALEGDAEAIAVQECDLGKVVSLVCYEMSDIGIRGKFRGNAEIIVNPCLNFDVDYFSAMQRSAARDLYGFVLAANTGLASGTLIARPTNSAAAVAAAFHGGVAPIVMTDELDMPILRGVRRTSEVPDRVSKYAPKYKDLPGAWPVEFNEGL